jgi:hypothetical protein
MRRGSAGRGLCYPCYRDRSVRALYPTLLMGPGAADCDEPTAAEVERVVAEQMRCLPKWFAEEWDRERDDEYVPKVYAIVRCK